MSYLWPEACQLAQCAADISYVASLLWAQLEVFPDEEIRVVNSNQVPDDDYTSVFDGVAGARWLVVTLLATQAQRNHDLCVVKRTRRLC